MALRQKTAKYPGWRTMSRAERYNAKMHAIFEEAAELKRAAERKATMFTLTIKTGNAAFSNDDPSYGDNAAACREEIARILRALAGELRDGGYASGNLRDYNGNIVGSYSLEMDGD